jgi:XrtJ-associated TM-motif-TM protein
MFYLCKKRFRRYTCPAIANRLNGPLNISLNCTFAAAVKITQTRPTLMKTLRFLSLALFVLATPALLHAQGGCVNSPENPTLVLGLAASVGTGVVALRNRRKR